MRMSMRRGLLGALVGVLLASVALAQDYDPPERPQRNVPGRKKAEVRGKEARRPEARKEAPRPGERPEQARQLRMGHLPQHAGRQGTGLLEIGQGPLHVDPSGVLRENGAYDGLEGAIAGPPPLRAVACHQTLIDVHEVGRETAPLHGVGSRGHGCLTSGRFGPYGSIGIRK